MRYKMDPRRTKQFNDLPLYNGLPEFCRNLTMNNSIPQEITKRAAALQMGPLFFGEKLSISLSNASPSEIPDRSQIESLAPREGCGGNNGSENGEEEVGVAVAEGRKALYINRLQPTCLAVLNEEEGLP
jgi:hypothetical protein